MDFLAELTKAKFGGIVRLYYAEFLIKYLEIPHNMITSQYS